MLSERYLQQLPTLLVSQAEFTPYPTAADRTPWEQLPSELGCNLISGAERYLAWQWPTLPATLFMEFRRTGNRSHYEHAHFARRDALTQLVLGECVEGKGRFLDDIINGTWHICEESFWGVPAHNYSSQHSGALLPSRAEPIIDLFAAETGSLLAWTHYLLQPQLNAVAPEVCVRIKQEVEQRILDPFLNRDDFWWMGLSGSRTLNNWTPWCNSTCLSAILLLEEHEEKRIKAVGKALRSLDRFLAGYPADGGCDEGPSYWGRAGGSLFDCLELLYLASRGQINVYAEPLVANIGRYLYQAFIDGNYFVNFADGGARVEIEADLVYAYGCRIHDPRLMSLGAYAHHLQGGKLHTRMASLFRLLPKLFRLAELDAVEFQPPYARDTWLPNLQFMAARAHECSAKGLYVAVKGGHNAESHNHNDVGQLVVYSDGEPVLIDVGVETYTAKTFSPHRYELWTMQSAYHNLPTINGVQQEAGRGYHATDVTYSSNDTVAEITMNLAAAYPPQAGLARWQRSVRLVRQDNGRLEVSEEFQLHRAGAIMLSLMTPYEPCVKSGAIELPTRQVGIYYHPLDLKVTCEQIPISDPQLASVWGDCLYRLLLAATAPAGSGAWQWQVHAM